jgi:hypothetical protein
MNTESILKRALPAAVIGLMFVIGCTSDSSTGVSPGDITAKAVFMFSSFSGEKGGLLLAYSEDLYNWTEIPGPHLKPTIGDNIMRDPFIMMGPGRIIHMVWTTGWGRRDIGYASTRDFINWSAPKLIPVMGKHPKARNCWAPKIFYDREQKQWQIIWSTWLDDGTFGAPELPHTSKQHRIWYATTKDFDKVSEPKVLFDPGYSCIDAYLLKGSKICILFFKDERYNDSTVVTPAHQNIRMALGSSRYGPFGNVSEPITGTGPGKWQNEGPCAVVMGGDFYVFYDHHGGDTYFGATKSKDLKSWTDVSEQMNIPKGFKHGSIIRVPSEIVKELLKKRGR